MDHNGNDLNVQVIPDPGNVELMADDVPWLTPDQLWTWMRLVALIEALPAAIDAQLKRDAGINRFEYMILVGLSDSPEKVMPMSRLALFATGSLSRLSHAVSRLEARGWVERRATGTGRHVDVHLTDAGQEAIVARAPGHVREARRLVADVLDADELAALGRACEKILDAISPEYTGILDEAFGRITGSAG